MRAPAGARPRPAVQGWTPEPRLKTVRGPHPSSQPPLASRGGDLGVAPRDFLLAPQGWEPPTQHCPSTEAEAEIRTRLDFANREAGEQPARGGVGWGVLGVPAPDRRLLDSRSISTKVYCFDRFVKGAKTRLSSSRKGTDLSQGPGRRPPPQPQVTCLHLGT